MNASDLYSFVLAFAAAAAAGLIGSFALMKRMSLAGDVISHVALPGLGLAFLIKVNPLWGGAAMLLLGTVLIWHLQRKTGLTAETTIGVIFAASVAVGALLTPEGDLIEALFGGFKAPQFPDLIAGLAVTLGVVAFVFAFKDKLVLALFSPELAAATGIQVDRLNLFFLLAFSVTVLLGLQFLGALLVGALIIVPAATGRQLTHTLGAFLGTSVLASVLSVTLGFFFANRYGIALGPAIVSVAATLFLASLLKKKT